MSRRQIYPVEAAWSRLLIVLRRIGRHEPLCVTAFGILAFGGAVLFGVFVGKPVPEIHDEFAYLLAGETFASGRLTNPPHPHWPFFETFHVLHQPTYSSKYPPGQGLWLALGEALAGHPAWGVWLSVGAASAALCWMLLAWLPPQWAVLAALFFTMQVGWASDWSQSYWGGAVAASGGALALGAFRRMWSWPSYGQGLLLGAGFAILASTRPMEGLLLAIFLVGALLYRVRAEDAGRGRRLIFYGLSPAVLVTLVGLGGLGIQNAAVTGSPMVMPYKAYQEQYGAAPSLMFLKPRPLPEYRHRVMRDYALNWAQARHNRQWQPLTFPVLSLRKLADLGLFFLGPGLLALLALSRRTFRPTSVLAWGGMATVVGAALFTKGTYTHYVAPAAPLMYFLLGRGLSILHRRARASRSINLALVATAVLVVFAPFHVAWFVSGDESSFPRDRIEVEEKLLGSVGPDLVFVRYAEGHSFHEEWVYNRADIDGAGVVWARDMGASENSILLEHYPDRTRWLLIVGQSVELGPYHAR